MGVEFRPVDSSDFVHGIHSAGTKPDTRTVRQFKQEFAVVTRETIMHDQNFALNDADNNRYLQTIPEGTLFKHAGSIYEVDCNAQIFRTKALGEKSESDMVCVMITELGKQK